MLDPGCEVRRIPLLRRSVNKGEQRAETATSPGPPACEILRLNRYGRITQVTILASPPKLRSQSSSFPFLDSPTSRPHSARLLKLPRFAAGGNVLAAPALPTVVVRSRCPVPVQLWVVVESVTPL